MRKIRKGYNAKTIIAFLMTILLFLDGTSYGSEFCLRKPLSTNLGRDVTRLNRAINRFESLFYASDDSNKLQYIKISVLQSLMDSVIEKVKIENIPTIERAFCVGSGLYLAKDGLIRLDKIRDLDMVLIFTQPTHDRDVIKQRFIEELANVLDDRSIKYRLESVSSKVLEAAEERGLGSEALAARKSLSLITPSGSYMGIEIDPYGSYEIFLNEQLVSLKDQLQSEDLLSHNPDIVSESEQSARFIKRYLRIEYLIGAPEKYTRYRDAFLDASVDEYEMLRETIKGELSRLKGIIEKPGNSKFDHMISDRLNSISRVMQKSI